MLLLSLSPHMHLRGKSFRYDLTWPGGKTETLLDVPRYDFNWQTAYRLAEPLPIPKGARLVAHASFDNSKDNLANPDPSATVLWGDQSWEEMMIGYADVAIERTGDPVRLANELRRSSLPDMAMRLFKSLDRNGNGQLERSEVEERFRERFDRLDADNDGVVTLEEFQNGIDLLRRLFGQ
jgi:hypothetical protein